MWRDSRYLLWIVSSRWAKGVKRSWLYDAPLSLSLSSLILRSLVIVLRANYYYGGKISGRLPTQSGTLLRECTHQQLVSRRVLAWGESLWARNEVAAVGKLFPDSVFASWLRLLRLKVYVAHDAAGVSLWQLALLAVVSLVNYASRVQTESKLIDADPLDYITPSSLKMQLQVRYTIILNLHKARRFNGAFSSHFLKI